VSDQPDTAAGADREDDERPVPWWVGHPVVRYPAIGLVWGTVLAFWKLEGDTELLVGFSLTIAVMALAIWSCVLMSCRTIPQYYCHSISPVAIIFVALGFIALSATMLVDLAFNPPTDDVEWTAGFGIAGFLFLASLALQVCSLSPAWPERWRPHRERPRWKREGDRVRTRRR
jgi:hypothetical protein